MPYNEADGNGGGIVKSCSPLSAAQWYGKNPACQWFKGGDFFASFAKKYYPSIDRLDRWNGWERYLVNVSEKPLKEYYKLCVRLLIIYHLGYALRVIKYSFGRWYLDEG